MSYEISNKNVLSGKDVCTASIVLIAATLCGILSTKTEVRSLDKEEKTEEETENKSAYYSVVDKFDIKEYNKQVDLNDLLQRKVNMSYLDEHYDEIFKKYSDEELKRDVRNYVDGGVF